MIEVYKEKILKRDRLAFDELQFEKSFYGNVETLIEGDLYKNYVHAKKTKNNIEFEVLDLWMRMNPKERRTASAWYQIHAKQKSQLEGKKNA